MLVGAGPALQSEFDMIKKYRDRLVLMACDAVVVPLNRQGIDPDFIVSAERVAQIAHLFEGVKPDSKAILFTLPSEHPLIFEKMAMPVVLIKRHPTFGSWLWPEEPKTAIPLGVSSMGFAALALLGFSEVYMLGQNLSLDDDAATTHVGGAVDFLLDSASQQTHYDVVDTVSYAGCPLKSLRMWKSFITEFEDLIRQFPKTRCYHVIDSRKGSRIVGALNMSPQEFWRGVESNFTPQTDAVMKFKEQVKAARGFDLKPRLHELSDYLLQLKKDCLDFMHSVSLDYHDHLDLKTNDQLWECLDAKLREWNGWQQKFLDADRHLYADFICCLFSDLHVSLLSAREAEIPERHTADKYFMTYTFKTVDWAQRLLAWTERTLHLVEKHVA